MKVALFCGGEGLRMRSGPSDDLPKPMVPLGNRPILWHIMKYYAHWGHKDFILCLGYKGASIKQFFVAHPGVDLQRLCPDRRRSQHRADAAGHGRLAHHGSRHGARRDDWRAPACRMRPCTSRAKRHSSQTIAMGSPIALCRRSSTGLHKAQAVAASTSWWFGRAFRCTS